MAAATPKCIQGTLQSLQSFLVEVNFYTFLSVVHFHGQHYGSPNGNFRLGNIAVARGPNDLRIDIVSSIVSCEGSSFRRFFDADEAVRRLP